MSVKKREQQKNLAFSDCFTLQNLYKFYYAISLKKLNLMSILKFQNPEQWKQIQRNKSVSQSEKAVPSFLLVSVAEIEHFLFDSRNRRQ